MRRFTLLISASWAGLLLALWALDGAVLGLIIAPLVYLMVALIFAPPSIELEVIRKLSADRVAHDTPVEITLQVTNLGKPLEDIQLVDLLPARLELAQGSPGFHGPLDQGETATWSYTVQARRGYFLFRGLQAVAAETFGILRRQRLIHAPSRLFVMPGAPRVRQIAIRPQRTLSYAGPIPARQGGPGLEFFGVREYIPGDALRWIHWKGIARHPDSFLTKEFEQERTTDVGVILDARRRSNLQHADDELFEYAVSAAASLSETFLNQGHRVGLLLYGKVLDWTFPGYGRIQRERIFHSLARSEPGDSMVFDRLDHLPTRFFPPKSQLVLVSPLHSDDPDRLIGLRARGYRVLVVSPDPIGFEARGLEPSPSVQLAVRIARLERSLVLSRLRRAGIRVLDWHVEAPFDQSVHAAFGRQSTLGRVAGRMQ